MPGILRANDHRPTVQPKAPTDRRGQSSSSRSGEATNTLIMTELPDAFFHVSVLSVLKSHFEGYGELFTWAPLKGFHRVVVVFWQVEDAERLRQECDGLVVGHGESSITLKLYRGDMTNTDLPEPESLHLQVPVSSKNFLISPPGSPPVGWEQIEEEAPNKAPLADDLFAALSKLQETQEMAGRTSKDGKKIIFDTTLPDSQYPQILQSANGLSSPIPPGHRRTNSGLLVLLEDVDERSRSDGSTTPDEILEPLMAEHENSSSRSPRAPGIGSITSVRATVDSMRPTAAPPQIERTPMPPPPS